MHKSVDFDDDDADIDDDDIDDDDDKNESLKHIKQYNYIHREASDAGCLLGWLRPIWRPPWKINPLATCHPLSKLTPNK